MIRSIHATLRSFKRDRRGVSAVEFALLSPFMVALYLGTVDISDAIGVDRKLTLTAGAIANLAAQTSSITATDMTDLLKAGTSVGVTPGEAPPGACGSVMRAIALRSALLDLG